MKTFVIVTRDPDYSNEYEVFEGDEVGVEIVTLDLGSMDPGEYDGEWRNSLVREARKSGASPEVLLTLMESCDAVIER